MANLFWKFAERFSAQMITLIVSVVLARLLEPEKHGVISMVMIFISIANVFVSDGFGSALIQKKDTDKLDFSSVLWFNIIISVVLYLLLFWGAPYIATFYGSGYDEMTPVLRVLGIRLIISAINSVQHAYVSRNMMFKIFFVSTISGTVISAVVGIIMAYSGFGVWALVGQYLTNTTVDTIVLFFVLKVYPVFKLSVKRLRCLLGFGSKILITSLMMCGYEQLRSLIIGKVYTSSDLAYYDKAKQFPSVITNNISSSISAVLFPKMAQLQDDKVKVKEVTRQSIRFSSYIMFPLMIGLFSIAKPFVILLLTEKWLSCVPLLQIMCINYLFMPLHSTNMQVVKALGRSDITLILETIKKVIELVVLIIVMKSGVKGIAFGMAACSTGFVLLNALPNCKLISYSFKEQISDIVSPLVMSGVMAVTVLGLGILECSNLVKVIMQVFVGGIVYIVLSVITRNKEFKYIIGALFQQIKKLKC